MTDHLEEAKLHKNDSKAEIDRGLAQILNGHSIACSLIFIGEQLERIADNQPYNPPPLYVMSDEERKELEDKTSYHCEGGCGGEVKSQGEFCGNCIPF